MVTIVLIRQILVPRPVSFRMDHDRILCSKDFGQDSCNLSRSGHEMANFAKTLPGRSHMYDVCLSAIGLYTSPKAYVRIRSDGE